MSSRDTEAEPFGVFRDKQGRLLWIGSAPSMEKALERARKDLGEHGPCDYLILDLKTEKTTVVTPEQLAGRHL